MANDPRLWYFLFALNGLLAIMNAMYVPGLFNTTMVLFDGFTALLCLRIADAEFSRIDGQR